MKRKPKDKGDASRKGGFFKKRFGSQNDEFEDFSLDFEFDDIDDNAPSSFSSAFSDFDPDLTLSDDEVPADGASAPADEEEAAEEGVPASPGEEEAAPEEEEAAPEEDLFPDFEVQDEAEENEAPADEGAGVHEAAEESEAPAEEETVAAGDEFVLPDEAESSECDADQDVGDDVPAPDGIPFTEDAGPSADDAPSKGTTDMNLRIAFGLEEEEEEQSVRKKMKKLGDKIESDPRRSKPVKLDCPEFTDPLQAKGIAGEYVRAAKFYNFRLAVAAILTLILLIYENIPAITTLFTGKAKQLSGALDPAVYPVVFTMVSLQILFVICAFGFKELKAGVRALFIGSPGPLSLTLLPVLMCTVHSIVTSIAASSRFEPTLFNSVAALAVTLSIMCARLDNKREMLTFFVAGSKRDKYAMRRLEEDDLLEEGDSFDDEEVGEVLKIEKTRFVDSFFARIQAPDATRRVFTVSVIGVCFVLAVLAAVYHYAHSGKTNEALTLGILIAVTVMPMSAYVAFSYPFYRAAKAAKSIDSAIIGDISLDEYAGASVVAFEDTSIFPSVGVKVQNIRIYNNARIDRVLYYAASAFAKAGGPLEDIFEIATMDMNKSDSVEILDAGKGFLATRIDGVNIYFGTYEELRRRGADINEQFAIDDVDFSGELSVMYMIREDKLVSKLYIKYDLDTDIEPILKQFNDGGVFMCIRTYDPNINEDMIASKLEMRDPPVKVIRYREESEVGAVSDRVDSGIVTTGSPKALLQLIPFCDNTARTKRDCMALGIVSSIISAVIVLLIFISGGIARTNSLFAAAYQLAWLLPAFLISKIFVR